MTRDPRFDDAAMKQCSKDMNLFDECVKFANQRGSGRLIVCLYDNLANITQPSCRYFINKMQAVVFNDWRLIEFFAHACIADIKTFECGRLDDENETVCIQSMKRKRNILFSSYHTNKELLLHVYRRNIVNLMDHVKRKFFV